MYRPIKLTDLFPNLVTDWPYHVIPGFAEGSELPETWLNQLISSVFISELYTGTSEEQVSLSCRYQVISTPTIDFRIKSIPQILFRIQNTSDEPEDPVSSKYGNLFVNIREEGTEVIIESLPVEIMIPPDFVFGKAVVSLEEIDEEDYAEEPFAGLSSDELEQAKTDFKKDPHAQFIILRDNKSDEGGATSVFTHLRLHIDANLEIKLATAMPISFGRCALFNLPVLAIHDFQLIPSPGLVYDYKRKLLDTGNWIRHHLWIPNEGMGAFAMRSIEFDTSSVYFRRKFPNGKRDVKAEWLFEDIIFPFDSGPIPIHFTLGFRRNFDNFTDSSDLFAFSTAAYTFQISSLIIRIYALYLQTVRLEDWGIKPLADFGFSFEKKNDDGTQLPNRKELSFEIGEEFTLRLGWVHAPNRIPKCGLQLSRKLIIHPVKYVVGYSIKKLTDHKDFLDSAEALVSLWIHDADAKWNPDGSDPGSIEDTPGEDPSPNHNTSLSMDCPKGKPLSLIINDLGWKQGDWSFGTVFSLPEGYGPKIGPVRIDLFEMGLLNEDDATYFSVSGGVQIGEGKKYEGGFWFKRMRFRIGGNESADFFKIDGFSGRLAMKDRFELEIGGHFIDETNVPLNYNKWELAFTGKLVLNIACIHATFAADLIKGTITQLDSQESFDYFMIQFFIDSLPVSGCVIKSGRVLFAHNMTPNLSDEDIAQDQLKYYHWQKTIDPLSVPGSRRLEGWKAEDDSLAIGMGAGISFAGCGDRFSLVAFLMYIDSPEAAENGIIISIDLYFGKPSNANDNQRTPIAWGVLEYNPDTSAWSVELGINLTLKTFVENAPDTLADIFKIKATIFISNTPGTFAIGRLDDQNSWAMLMFDWDFLGIAKAYSKIAFCAEFVEGGNKGIGVTFRVETGVDCGCFGIFFHAGALMLWKSFNTGSNDFVVLISANIGGSVKLFWVINFGLDLDIEVRYLAHAPTFTATEIRIHISTSWWLPDISWSLEYTSGEIEPAARPMLAAPLGMASSLHAATGKNVIIHLESIAKGLFSINDCDDLAIPEATRLQRFSDAIRSESGPLEPIATDSTIIIKFSNPVDQSLGIGPIDDNWGVQLSGDDENYMQLQYRLAAISIRRRPRFGSHRPWTNIEVHRGMQIISPETGEPIEGSVTFGQTNLTYHWDEDIQEKGRTVPVQLLINSDTPFSFTTESMEADENIVAENPEWPCCKKTKVQWHWYYYRDEATGILDKHLRRLFYKANGFEIITADGLIVPKKLTDGSDPVNVAAFSIEGTKQIMRMVFDEDAIVAGIFVNPQIKHKASITLIAENALGELVIAKTYDFSGRKQEWEYITISGKAFRSVSVIADFYEKKWLLFVDMATWLSVSDYEKNQTGKKSCASENPNRKTDFSGKGSLFFLPNQEYEISFETELSVRHNSTEWEKRTCKEFAYFITKGLPGLNYTKNIGTEIAPYVQSSYPLMRPFIYAEEPVILVLNEKFKLTLPISVRRPGELEEHIQMMNLRLLVKSNAANRQTIGTDETSIDWITAKAQSRSVLIKGEFINKTSPAKSTDAKLNRLANLRNISTVGDCSAMDVTNVNHSILAAFPSDQTIDGIKYWNSGKDCTAYLQLENLIYINHASFTLTDLLAFSFATHATGTWDIKDNKLNGHGMTRLETAGFGETDWNYFSLATEISKLDGEAGFIFAKNNSPATHLYVLVSNTAAGTKLKIYNSYPAGVIAEYSYPAKDKTQLRVMAYDDQVAISIDEEIVTFPRNGIGNGSCAFAVKGKASFTNLFAEPLPMYAFNFRVSKFKSFHKHISDFESVLYNSAISFDTDFQSARTTLTALIEKAMSKKSSDTEREALFIKFASAGGIFLGENLTKSRVTSLAGSGNNCAALLIESVESLDVAAGELELKLANKFILEQTNPITNLHGLNDILAAAKQSSKGHTFHAGFLNEFILPGIMETEGFSRIDSFANAISEWTYNPLISGIKVTKGRNKNELSISVTYISLLVLLPGIPMLFLQYNQPKKELSIYDCVVEGKKKITAVLKESISLNLPQGWFTTNETKMIDLIVVPGENKVIFGSRAVDTIEWRDSNIVLIQNHDARKLLLIPENADTFFGAGDWKLSFKLNRIRYATTDSGDDLSRYNSNKNIHFTITP
ncbi:MAG: hypothetical protein QM737_02590 [Ferruginibacter sp.]